MDVGWAMLNQNQNKADDPKHPNIRKASAETEVFEASTVWAQLNNGLFIYNRSASQNSGSPSLLFWRQDPTQSPEYSLFLWRQSQSRIKIPSNGKVSETAARLLLFLATVTGHGLFGVEQDGCHDSRRMILGMCTVVCELCVSGVHSTIYFGKDQLNSWLLALLVQLNNCIVPIHDLWPMY